MRKRFRRWAGVGVGAVMMALVMAACTGAGGQTAPSAGPASSAGATASADTSSTWPVFGFTHTQYTVDYGNDQAVKTIHEALATKRVLQNQHIMGFGALNPEPSPGQYDFSSLDDRIALIRKTRGVPIITLCCAPDWMKGGTAGDTDWNHIEVAPLAKHYQDFANLAAKVAERYPDVRHYIVWNELKGFFDEDKHRWNYEGYTDMYNRVYKALKAVNPKINVGGPYPVMADFDGPTELRGDWGNVDQRVLDALRYWNKHKAGADFVVVDGSAENDDGLTPDDFGAQRKFSAINQWLHKNIHLPIWWAEWYAEPDNADWPQDKLTAVNAVAMMEFARSRTTAALYWSRQEEGQACPVGCLWTSPRSAGGGRPTPLLTAMQQFARWFPKGTRTRSVEVSSPAVRALAQNMMMVVVNTEGTRTQARVDGQRLDLAPYEVRWVARA